MTTLKQQEQAVQYLLTMLEQSPLLEEEQKTALSVILQGTPSLEFLKDLYQLLKEEARQFDEILTTMSNEELEQVYMKVKSTEVGAKRNERKQLENTQIHEEEAFLKDIENYFQSQ